MTRVTRLEFDSNYGGNASIVVSRAPDGPTPDVHDLPADMAAALLDWLGVERNEIRRISTESRGN
jgi:hypothetical protein